MENKNELAKTKQRTTKLDIKETTTGLLRGFLTGLTVPIMTVPVDKYQTKKVIDPTYKIKDFLKIPNKYKGYKFVISGHIPRNCAIYLSAPLIEGNLRTHGISATGSNTIGYLGAGILDAICTGPFHVIRQAIFTTEASSAKDVFKAMPSKEILWKSMWSSHYIILRNGIFWPIYNSFLETAKKYTRPKKNDSIAIRETKEFLMGASCGLLASFVSYPFDAMQKLKIHNPNISFYKIISNAFTSKDFTQCKTTFYGGLSSALLRMFFAMGMNNFAVDRADWIVETTHNHMKRS